MRLPTAPRRLDTPSTRGLALNDLIESCELAGSQLRGTDEDSYADGVLLFDQRLSRPTAVVNPGGKEPQPPETFDAELRSRVGVRAEAQYGFVARLVPPRQLGHVDGVGRSENASELIARVDRNDPKPGSFDREDVEQAGAEHVRAEPSISAPVFPHSDDQGELQFAFCAIALESEASITLPSAFGEIRQPPEEPHDVVVNALRVEGMTGHVVSPLQSEGELEFPGWSFP